MKNLPKLSAEYLEAYKALKDAEAEIQHLEARLIEALQLSGVKSTVIDGHKITLVEGERPKYNTEALADLVSPALFKSVTKPAIDGKKFKAAMELGKIADDIAEAVTTKTPYANLRVTPSVAETIVPEKMKKVS
jgi:hypothetical protein